MLKKYIVTLIIFLALDALWLGLISPALYRAHIGHLLADSPNFVAAGAFYLIFISGLLYFAVNPASKDYRTSQAALRGAFFGFVTYATFDLTSQAVMRDWPTLITIIDLAWGSFICGATTVIAARLTRESPDASSSV